MGVVSSNCIAEITNAVYLAPVNNLADIEAVLKQMGERAHAKPLTADGEAVR